MMVLGACDVLRSLTRVCLERRHMIPTLTLMAVREELPLPYQLDVRPSQEFSYEAAKIKLAHLDLTVASTDGTSFLVPGDASTYEDEQDHENFGCTNRQGRLLRLSSRIDLENRVAIGCMGAVITHLQRRRAADYLPDDPDAQWAFRVRSLEMFTLRNTMSVVERQQKPPLIFAGLSIRTHSSRCRSHNQSPIRMHSIKVLVRPGRKNRSLYTGSSIITHARPKEKSDCVRTFSDPALT